MIFQGIDRQTVELKITSYQFPENQDGDWDGNWLNIYLKVDSKVGKWQTIKPSLTTWEVQDIIEWSIPTPKDSPAIKKPSHIHGLLYSALSSSIVVILAPPNQDF